MNKIKGGCWKWITVSYYSGAVQFLIHRMGCWKVRWTNGIYTVWWTSYDRIFRAHKCTSPEKTHPYRKSLQGTITKVVIMNCGQSSREQIRWRLNTIILCYCTSLSCHMSKICIHWYKKLELSLLTFGRFSTNRSSFMFSRSAAQSARHYSFLLHIFTVELNTLLDWFTLSILMSALCWDSSKCRRYS